MPKAGGVPEDFLDGPGRSRYEASPMSFAHAESWSFLREWVESRPTPAAARVAFLMPIPCDDFFALWERVGRGSQVIHTFCPQVVELKSRVGSVDQSLGAGPFDWIFFVPTKQRLESLAWMAEALGRLSPEGTLIVACPNNEGASGYISRLKDLASEWDLESAHKAKRMALKKSSLRSDAAHDLLAWIHEVQPRPIAGTSYHGVPGIFGWNKIDRGSELLVASLPELKGKGADLGAGYAYLSVEALKKYPGIVSLHLFEAESRAIECARQNVAAVAGSENAAKVFYHWTDVEGESLLRHVRDLDFVLMNPPFHEGISSDAEIGRRFIARAAEILRPGGQIFLVANRFLAYEDSLEKLFKKSKRVFEGEGFKVIHAQK